MTVDELPFRNCSPISSSCCFRYSGGTYQPRPVKQVEIPKPDGSGMRKLGIPTVLDRFVQQAVLQVLQKRCLKRGYAADFGRWCGSNGSVDERGVASFANGAWVRTWRRKPRAALMARGGSRTRPP